MSSLVSLHLDNVEYNADRIARLFPKCKPKNSQTKNVSLKNASATVVPCIRYNNSHSTSTINGATVPNYFKRSDTSPSSPQPFVDINKNSLILDYDVVDDIDDAHRDDQLMDDNVNIANVFATGCRIREKRATVDVCGLDDRRGNVNAIMGADSHSLACASVTSASAAVPDANEESSCTTNSRTSSPFDLSDEEEKEEKDEEEDDDDEDEDNDEIEDGEDDESENDDEKTRSPRIVLLTSSDAGTGVGVAGSGVGSSTTATITAPILSASSSSSSYHHQQYHHRHGGGGGGGGDAQANSQRHHRGGETAVATSGGGGRRSHAAAAAGYSHKRSKTHTKQSPSGNNEFQYKLRDSRINDDKKRDNAQEITETVFSTEVKSMKYPQTISLGIDGSIVFDDIDDIDDNYWKNDNAASNTLSAFIAQPTSSTYQPSNNHQPHIVSKEEKFRVANKSETSSEQPTNDKTAISGGGGVTKTTRGPHIIGNLPIAEYEGSPRRYGLRSSSDNVMPRLLPSPTVTHPVPLPGFPQRVVQFEDNSPSAVAAASPADAIAAPAVTCATNSSSSFNYLYEYSETRKVLEEFFKPSETHRARQFHELDYELKKRRRSSYDECESGGGGDQGGNSYVALRLAEAKDANTSCLLSPRKHGRNASEYSNRKRNALLNYAASSENFGSGSEFHLVGDGGSAAGRERENAIAIAAAVAANHRNRFSISPDLERRFGQSRNFTLSPETTDCESNFGEADSDDVSSLMLTTEADGAAVGTGGAAGCCGSTANSVVDRLYPSMPILEDGLSSGHTSDNENNKATIMLMKKQITEIEREIVEKSNRLQSSAETTTTMSPAASVNVTSPDSSHAKPVNFEIVSSPCLTLDAINRLQESEKADDNALTCDTEGEALAPLDVTAQMDANTFRNASSSPPSGSSSSAPFKRAPPNVDAAKGVEATIKDIRMTLQRTKTLPLRPLCVAANKDAADERESTAVASNKSETPIWIPRRKGTGSGPSADEDEADTDLETDRLLGQQRTDDRGFFDEKVENENGKKKSRNKEGFLRDPSVLIEGVLFRARYLGSTQLVCEGQPTKATRMMQAEEAVSRIKVENHHAGCEKARSTFGSDTDDSEDVLGTDLGPGSMFRLRFLGSVEVDEEEQVKNTKRGAATKKRLKKNMVEEAVIKIKAPEGESQPSTEVDLFISTEKIMVLNSDLKEIMMDHALRTISYIADIGDLVVLMARRRFIPHDMDDPSKMNRTPKMICHVFESEEAQFIAQSIGQAFQVAYMEFLKANGIEDHSFVKEMDYQEVLNSQEIFGDELQMFAKKELQKEVVVPKVKGEILGVVIVESGWGSMLPTVVIANLAPTGAAARCGQLNIGDQIIAVNGVSLVGLPLSTCQNYIKNSKPHTVVKLTVVPCAPVVEVKIKRPDTKYQLGFSVQNGVICSLLRGGIAERGGVRVGHRIIEINNQSVVAVPHEKIVTLLATSVGEILMKTMPTSMFRLLTGQETPVFI